MRFFGLWVLDTQAIRLAKGNLRSHHARQTRLCPPREARLTSPHDPRLTIVTVPEPKEPAPDQELIEAWCNGDELAATELVRRHAGALAGFLRGAGADPDDVDDVVQETFFRGFRRIETFRGGAAFRTWLMAIGSNALKDLWRKRQRRQVIPIDDRDFLDPRSDVSGEALARDLAGRLAEAVKVLPTLQRDVFLLRAQQGVAYDEIARVLGTTPGAARVHYHHAVKRLKKVLED